MSVHASVDTEDPCDFCHSTDESRDYCQHCESTHCAACRWEHFDNCPDARAKEREEDQWEPSLTCFLDADAAG